MFLSSIKREVRKISRRSCAVTAKKSTKKRDARAKMLFCQCCPSRCRRRRRCLISSLLTTPENTITYHNALCLSPPKFGISIVFSFSWEFKWPQEKLKTMLMQNLGVTNKEHYGMLWYFLESSIPVLRHCGSSWHNALIIISEKMASIRRILQTGQTGNLANASYQQPRRVPLKHFCLLLRCDDGLEKELGNWLLFSYFYPTFVFSCRSV